jgi:hypothetical protein
MIRHQVTKYMETAIYLEGFQGKGLPGLVAHTIHIGIE